MPVMHSRIPSLRNTNKSPRCYIRQQRTPKICSKPIPDIVPYPPCESSNIRLDLMLCRQVADSLYCKHMHAIKIIFIIHYRGDLERVHWYNAVMTTTQRCPSWLCIKGRFCPEFFWPNFLAGREGGSKNANRTQSIDLITGHPWANGSFLLFPISAFFPFCFWISFLANCLIM